MAVSTEANRLFGSEKRRTRIGCISCYTVFGFARDGRNREGLGQRVSGVVARDWKANDALWEWTVERGGGNADVSRGCWGVVRRAWGRRGTGDGGRADGVCVAGVSVSASGVGERNGDGQRLARKEKRVRRTHDDVDRHHGAGRGAGRHLIYKCSTRHTSLRHLTASAPPLSTLTSTGDSVMVRPPLSALFRSRVGMRSMDTALIPCGSALPMLLAVVGVTLGAE